MHKRMLLWTVPGVLWLLFTIWYTDFGGPLSEAEIDSGISSMQVNGFTSAEGLAKLRAFLTKDTGRQFLMVNNIDMNEHPPSMPGFGAEATAADYVNHYMEHMYTQLFKRACHPVFFGSGLGFVADLTGITGPVASGWDSAALFRYRSRRSFLEIIAHPEMQSRHSYKLAAMVKTLAYPVEPSLYVSDLRFILFLVLGFMTAILDILVFGVKQKNEQEQTPV